MIVCTHMYTMYCCQNDHFSIQKFMCKSKSCIIPMTFASISTLCICTTYITHTFLSFSFIIIVWKMITTITFQFNQCVFTPCVYLFRLPFIHIVMILCLFQYKYIFELLIHKEIGNDKHLMAITVEVKVLLRVVNFIKILNI